MLWFKPGMQSNILKPTTPLVSGELMVVRHTKSQEATELVAIIQIKGECAGSLDVSGGNGEKYLD